MNGVITSILGTSYIVLSAKGVGMSYPDDVEVLERALAKLNSIHGKEFFTAFELNLVKGLVERELNYKARRI